MPLADDIYMIRLLIGDIEGSPFYQLFTDDDLEKFLNMANGDVMGAARLAAISASMQISGWTTRERTGDIEVWSSLSTQYLKALQNLLNNPGNIIPQNLYPWYAGEGSCNKLMNINVCDEDLLKKPCKPVIPDSCGC